MSEQSEGITPGPWQATRIPDAWEVFAPGMNFVASALREPDAKLIASAPELREENQRLFEENRALREHICIIEYAMDGEDVTDGFRAVICKAYDYCLRTRAKSVTADFLTHTPTDAECEETNQNIEKENEK